MYTETVLGNTEAVNSLVAKDQFPCLAGGHQESIRWRIANADSTPMGVAGLWSAWHAPNNRWVFSVTMLTVNADSHPLMQRFHKPVDEKRMVVVLDPTEYEGWLRSSPSDARSYLQHYAAELMVAEAAPLPSKPSQVAKMFEGVKPNSHQGTLF